MKSTALRIHILAITFSVVLCSSIGFYGDDDDSDERQSALDVFQTAAKRRSRSQADYAYHNWPRGCKRWNQWCDPWTGYSEKKCCPEAKLACKCNLWGQNCKCVMKLWGR
ncbi:uncharacterized protein LOC141914719 isoform X1 [Tubulanus polymorphus]|uniref:uncharacterized protein LOC141914719 isoform X1 n=1 Tax=Tubulanus polymorphus TaxID=672921 RepID=UPI003DA67CDA